MKQASCNKIRPRLSAYHDGALAPDRRAAIERHLADCDGCRGELEATARVAGIVAGAALEARPGFEARLRAHLQTQGQQDQRWAARARLARRLSLLSAAFLVVAVAGLGPALLRDWRQARLDASDAQVLQLALFGPAESETNGSSR
jgi:anti-sigma factor RsiW